jgi:hypothetical protein
MKFALIASLLCASHIALPVKANYDRHFICEGEDAAVKSSWVLDIDVNDRWAAIGFELSEPEGKSMQLYTTPVVENEIELPSPSAPGAVQVYLKVTPPYEMTFKAMQDGMVVAPITNPYTKYSCALVP